jgi:hypothetical protein
VLTNTGLAMHTNHDTIAPSREGVNRSTSNDTAAAAPPSPRPSESETLTDEDRWTLRHARQAAAERETFPELVDLDEARSRLHSGLVALSRVASAATCDEGCFEGEYAAVERDRLDHVSREIVSTMSALSLVAEGIHDAWKRTNDRRLKSREEHSFKDLLRAHMPAGPTYDPKTGTITNEHGELFRNAISVRVGERYDPYRTRALVLGAAHEQGFDADAIEIVRTIKTADGTDPGPDFWLGELRRWRTNLETLGPDPKDDDASPPSSPAA